MPIKLTELDDEIIGISEPEIKENFEEYFSLLVKNKMRKCFKFYKSLVGTVEINREGEISKIYFKKPFLSKYITPHIKEHLIYSANRNSDQERIEFFLYNIDLYQMELEWRQKLSRNKVILNF